jgi:glycosyltransferase involved in cell wall biosynthesis
MPRVLFVQYTNPGGYPPIVHAAHLLAEAGCDVRMLGVCISENAALTVPRHPRIDVRYMPEAGRGVRQHARYARFVLAALGTVLRWRPQWIYASDVLAAPVAAVVSLLPGLRVVYHEHDVPLARRPSRLMRWCLAARRRVAREADMAIAPNADRARLLARVSGRLREVLTIWNCPRRADVRTRRRGVDGPLRVVYQGSIVPDRLPLSAIGAIAQSPGTELVIAGYTVDGARGYSDELQREAIRRGVADRVHFLGPIDRAPLLDLTAECDLGLALMPVTSADASMQMMVGASNKAFEYLACGLPALVTDLPDWRAAFVDPGLALACDPRDEASIARVLTWCAEHRGEVAAMGRRGRERILDSWNYEAQFAVVREAIVGDQAPPALASGDVGTAGARSRREVPA